VKQLCWRAFWAAAFVIGVMMGPLVSQAEPARENGISLDDVAAAMRPFAPAKAEIVFDDGGSKATLAHALEDMLSRAGWKTQVWYDWLYGLHTLRVHACKSSDKKNNEAALALIAGLKAETGDPLNCDATIRIMIGAY
jgi:hypothetical protein